MPRLRLADIGLALLTCGAVAAAAFALRPQTPPVQPAVPPPVHAVFLGDDTLGEATAEPTGSAAVAARLLGWDATVRAEAGSGFVARGVTGDYDARIPQAVTGRTDVLVLLAGVYDRSVLADRLDAAVRRAVDTARARLPAGGSLVLVGPFGTTLFPDLPMRRVRNVVRLVAEQERVPFIDPLEQAWLVPDADYLQTDGLHPTPDGDQAFGRRLAAALERLSLTPAP